MKVTTPNNRTVYYVQWATKEEHAQGIKHTSKEYEIKGDAKFGAYLKEQNNEFVTIEKVEEVHNGTEWIPKTN